MGLIKAVALAGIKKNIIGLVATCENMPSSTATRPGDIVKSYSGKTIEICVRFVKKKHLVLT